MLTKITEIEIYDISNVLFKIRPIADDKNYCTLKTLFGCLLADEQRIIEGFCTHYISFLPSHLFFKYWAHFVQGHLINKC